MVVSFSCTGDWNEMRDMTSSMPRTSPSRESQNFWYPPTSESFARVQNSLNFRAHCLMSVAILGILYQIRWEMAFA